MADDVVDVEFTNVELSNGPGEFAKITGTLKIDYTTDKITGPLTVTITDGLTGPVVGHYTFSSFGPLGLISSIYYGSSIAYPNSLNFAYTGQLPSSLLQATVLLNSGTNNFVTFVSNDLTSTVVCFASGTLIRTAHGDVPVEALRVGDHVLTTSNARRPIKWLGHRKFYRGFGEISSPKHEVVRILAHAFGADRPSQDLVVSPGHSICFDLIGEVMIPAMALVNGATVVRTLLDEVTLWHVELDSHDVLIANNVPAESYLAMGNRGVFEEAGATVELFEDGKTKTHADFCRPVAVDGPIPDFVRSRLTKRARSLGWMPSYDDDLHLVADGRVRRPLREGDAAVFLFPSDARDVRLVSNTFSPKDFGSSDTRVLGAMLLGFVFSGAEGESPPGRDRRPAPSRWRV